MVFLLLVKLICGSAANSYEFYLKFVHGLVVNSMNLFEIRTGDAADS